MKRSQVAFRNIIGRFPLLSMYVIMFLLAWAVLIPDALASQGLVSFRIPRMLPFLSGWAPAVSAIIVTLVISGGQGLRELFSRFLIVGVPVGWYLMALFLLALAILGGIALHILFGGSSPAVPASGAPWWRIIAVFVVTVLLGILVNTEEIAWRGFALVRLSAQYNALTAALLIAIPETLFHMPYFFNKSIAFYRTVGWFSFTVFSLALSVVYAWTFFNTKGSLLIVTLLHASQNAWAGLLSDNSARPFYFTVALLVLFAVAVVAFSGKNLSRLPAAARFGGGHRTDRSPRVC